MADLNFNVVGYSETPMRINVKAGKFNLVIDEPPSFGGDDMGANPLDYLLATFAGCVNIMAHMIAKEMNMNLEKLTVKVEGNLNPDCFLGKSFDERPGYKQIQMKLEPVTNASPELLEKWVNEIKRRCPINDNLSNPTPVSLTL